MKRGLLHLYKRKKEGDYPSKRKNIALLDRIVLLLACVAPIFEIPQLLEIYLNKSAVNVSIITWGFFSLMAIPWFLYGIVHKEKPIIVLYLLWFLIDTTTLIGILMYS